MLHIIKYFSFFFSLAFLTVEASAADFFQLRIGSSMRLESVEHQILITSPVGGFRLDFIKDGAVRFLKNDGEGKWIKVCLEKAEFFLLKKIACKRRMLVGNKRSRARSVEKYEIGMVNRVDILKVCFNHLSREVEFFYASKQKRMASMQRPPVSPCFGQTSFYEKFSGPVSKIRPADALSSQSSSQSRPSSAIGWQAGASTSRPGSSITVQTGGTSGPNSRSTSPFLPFISNGAAENLELSSSPGAENTKSSLHFSL